MYTFWDLICDNLDKPWNWHDISYNPNITWDIIQNNPDKPWDWQGISENPNITPRIVKDNPDIPWNWYNLSHNHMNQPYYRSFHHKKLLANQLASAIFDELIAVTCNPRRHPANYMPTCDLLDHPFGKLTQINLDEI